MPNNYVCLKCLLTYSNIFVRCEPFLCLCKVYALTTEIGMNSDSFFINNFGSSSAEFSNGAFGSKSKLFPSTT